MPETSQEDRKVNTNFLMREAEHRDLKIWCVTNGMTLTEAFIDGVSLLRALRDLFGPERGGALLDLVGSARVFVLDPERDLRIERRGENIWAICDGGMLVNRDGHLEEEPAPSSRDEAFLLRTRFTLPEALRLARARVGGDA